MMVQKLLAFQTKMITIQRKEKEMNWDIFYMGLYFGTIGDITEDKDEALKKKNIF